MKNRWIVWLIMFILWASGLVLASDAHDHHMMLRDVRGVEVFVKATHANLAAVSLSKDQLHMAIMHRLRHAGIRILAEDEAPATPGLPVFYVDLKTDKYRADIYAYHIDVSLREVVRLERNDALFIDAPSWAESELGILSRNEIKKLQDRIFYYVDKFIVTYQLANPHLLVEVTQTFPPHFTFEDRLREVQHRLKEAGFEPGPIDGKFGTMTKRALRQFQRANDIPTTGTLDEVTQKALGIQMVTAPPRDK